MGLLDLS